MRGFFAGYSRLGGNNVATNPILPSVTFEPVGGTYPNHDFPLVVRVACANPNAEIRLTWDGSTPTYYHYHWHVRGSGNIGNVNIGITLKATAYLGGYNPPAVTSATYLATDTCSRPTFSPPPAWYPDATFPRAVVITSATASCQIRYTVNGADPNVGGIIITNGAAASVPSGATLRAIAFRSAYVNSAEMSGVYAPGHLLAPTFQPNTGTANAQQQMTIAIASASAGVNMRWTSGNPPAVPSNTVGTLIASNYGQATFPVPSNGTTVKACVYKSGYNNVISQSGSYNRHT